MTLPEFLNEYATRKALAQSFGRTERTIVRWNLPSVRIGGQTLYHIPSVRQYLTELEQKQQRRAGSRR